MSVNSIQTSLQVQTVPPRTDQTIAKQLDQEDGQRKASEKSSEKTEATLKEILKAMEDPQATEKLFVDNTVMRISVDEDTDQTVIQLIDKESGELKRQFPPEELIEHARKFDELKGLLFDTHT